MKLTLPLDRAWKFRRLPAVGATGGWEVVDLPHSPFVADLDGREHWFGICEYQRTIQVPPEAPAGRAALHVGAAMHSAVVLLDGVEIGRHAGGYLPFEVELPGSLRDHQPHTLTLRLDNQDNPDVPPGKPFADLDFCWYGGLYRAVELRCYPEIHITDPIAANAVAGGGVFVRTLAASSAAATVSVTTGIRNDGAAARSVQVGVELWQDGSVVARGEHQGTTPLAPSSSTAVEIQLTVARPRLWQPDAPALCEVRVTVRATEGGPPDERTVRCGIRRIAFSRSGGFTINGQRMHLRGTNRHQEYPYLGYAVPPAAQRRDVRRIKEAGFDYVRLSHYPQAPDFLDACDELGVVVMNCIPGWQFLGGERFREACAQNAREVIRRDRNHPCVVLWELSLNETLMDEPFMARLHAIGHEEYPGDQMFTCGWLDHYDVFIHSRQHGQLHRWQNGDKALVVAEYGDWEFYAPNEGFDQKSGAGTFADWSHGRQLRATGERGLRQQAWNHVIALNDTLGSPAVLTGLWSMFDYARGYDPNRAACGIMDVFRLPKFSWHFFRSQRSPDESGEGWTGGPAVFIASHWTVASDLRIVVFSNCEEVELRCNGVLIGRQGPGKAWMTQYLPHPPLVFDLPAFVSGDLTATGFIAGTKVASHQVTTPGAPARLEIVFDDAGGAPAAGEPDAIIAHARITDQRGNLCVDEVAPVSFVVGNGVRLAGPASIAAEAGVASVLLLIPRDPTTFVLAAKVAGPTGNFAASRTWTHPSPGPTTAIPAVASIPREVPK